VGKAKRLRREKEAAAKLAVASTGLPSFKLKVERARIHLENLGFAVEEWLKTHKDLVREEADPETGDDLVVVDPPAGSPSDAIALTAADCIHNLRASLDQIVYSLSWAYTCGPLTKEVAERCEFPIYGPRAPTAADLRKRIGAIDPDAQIFIQDLQPHHAGDAFASEKLWVLDQLWNVDKHRTLPLTIFGQQAVRLNPEALRHDDPDVTVSATYRVGGPIHRKTEIVRFEGGRPEAYPNPKDAAVLDIAFGEGTPAYGHAVVPFLTGLADYVSEEIIAPLSAYMPP
jgi:hypothetical protein